MTEPQTWQEQAQARNRCRNCGELGHYTQQCDQFGPLFHEPGKTREDYAARNKEILDLVANDIIEEHNGE